MTGSSKDIPKAILYSFPTSVWSTVQLLCLHEKGYSEDEYVIKQVDITKGELICRHSKNFAPSYLKINMNGTIPTLVVPTYETTGEEGETKYRSLRDTTTICDFLDQARNMNTARSVTGKPAPALAPATIEGKSNSDLFISLVHLPQVDPNFLAMSARTPDELKANAAGYPGRMLSDRRQALQRYIAEAKQTAQSGVSYDANVVKFLEEKAAANDTLWTVYNGDAEADRIKAFHSASRNAWEEEIPNTLDKFEELIAGPFALGDQVSLADLHVIAWFTRLVAVSGGSADASGLSALEARLGGRKIGPKMQALWAEWVTRLSFQKVLIPACAAFRSLREP